MGTVIKYAIPAAATSIVCTLLGCAHVSWRMGHLSPYVTRFPPIISLTGRLMPERLIYAVGLSLVAASMAYLGRYVHGFVVPRLTRGGGDQVGRLNTAAWWSIYVAAAGLCVQSVIPLQSDIFAVMNGEGSLKAQSVIHQGAALIFFLLTMLHTYLLLYMIKKSPKLNQHLGGTMWYLRAGILCASVLALFLGAFYHPTSPKLVTTGASTADIKVEIIANQLFVGALSQWLWCLCFVLILCVYDYELKKLSPLLSYSHSFSFDQ
ncbi:hypothetical protein Pelo_11287 [Pelomyxa schiedti]|nr:hypothetical protein Pelo_11287 [Pelomyxa schiedti]